MCGISGFYNPQISYLCERRKWKDRINKMNEVQKHRGPDGDGIYMHEHCCLGHVRLAVIDLYTGAQPMSRQEGPRKCTVSFNGEIYNMHTLKSELKKAGCHFETASDTEVLLAGYMQEGETFFSKINGIFAFALWDEGNEKLILCRDRLGVKPLFYKHIDKNIIFASEIKGILCYPGCQPVITKEGLCEIFALGPAKTPGKGIFKDIKEILPGHYMTVVKGEIREHVYWELESKEHTDTFDETVDKTRWLVEDAIKSQMLSDVPISTFLSGGIDSSIVTAVCAENLSVKNETLKTFSFDFEGNSEYYKMNAFQPSLDRPYINKMVEYSKTEPVYLECSNEQLEHYLYDAVDARDLPCMADIESSLLYFCSEVVHYNKVALTGECADEIFGGYPWFHNQNMFRKKAFPWSYDMSVRKSLLSEEILDVLPLDEYALQAYEESVQKTPVLEGESAKEKRRREVAYLNLKWFMVTLLDRMDRTSMKCGLEARVPFADYRIVEYLWNVPWEMKCAGNREKGLLRKAAEGIVPDEILYRKKSPYPKTYHPEYEKMLSVKLTEIVGDCSAPIGQFIDSKKLNQLLKTPSDYGKPWYGQLMAGPQLIAYYLQTNYWLKKYQIKIEI